MAYKDPDKYKQYYKKYYLENKEVIKENLKDYYLKNKEEIFKRNKKWRSKNKDKIKQYLNKYLSKDPTYQIFVSAKQRAKKKNLPFDIDKEYLKSIYPKDSMCPALNVPFQIGFLNENKKNKDYAPSLDRLVPKKGYVKGNVIIICNIVNRVKTNASLEIIEKVFNFYKKLNVKTS
jgi:hypothetical protein